MVNPNWVIGVTASIVFLVVSLTICVICWCFKKRPENDRVSMKPLTSNYSDPSDAITPQRSGSVYNYSNPYDKRGSDAGVMTVKQKQSSNSRRNSKEKNSKSKNKPQHQNYSYFEPYDARSPKKGVVAVKSSEKSSVEKKSSESSNNHRQNKVNVPNGNYLNVEIPEDNAKEQIKKLEEEKVHDVSNSYSDVIYKPNNDVASIETRSGSRKNVPAPYSVVHLDL